MGYIYKITNIINNKVYIGQTKKDPAIRWKNEKSGAFNSNHNQYDTLLSRSFRKYGIENFKFEVIEECSNSLLNDREIYWIEYYHSFDNGLNMTKGGQTPTYQKNDKCTLQSIIEDLKQPILSQKEIAEKYTLNKDTVCGINTGRMWYDENLSYPIRKFNILTAKNEQKPKQVKVESYIKNESTKIQYAKDVYETSFRVAAKKYGITDNSLRKRCAMLGLPTHTKELKDWYAINILKITPVLKEKPIKYKIYQYDEKMNLINIFDSAADAGRYLGNVDKRSHILDCCNGKRQTAYGFIWKKEPNPVE